MRNMKKVLSFSLAVFLLVGLMAFPVQAADGPTLTLDSAVGVVGKDLYLNLTLSGNDTVGMKALNAVILYNKSALTCSYFDESADVDDNDSAWETFQAYCDEQKYNKKNNPTGIYSAVSPSVTYNYETAELPAGYDAETYGVVKLGYLFDTTFAEGKTGVGGFAANGVIGQLGFDVAENAQLGKSDLILLVTLYTDGSGNVITDSINVVPGAITVIKPGVNLSAAAITVDGTAAQTVTASAVKADGTTDTGAAFTVTDSHGTVMSWVSGGTITVPAKAAAGEYTVAATIDGEEKSAAALCP